jgi:hypothetical protein
MFLKCFEDAAYYAFHALLHMGMFGADSMKAVKLWCNRRCILKLPGMAPRRWFPVSVGITNKRTDKDGKTHIDGAKGLKDTQTYPVLFGAAIGRVYAEEKYKISPGGPQAPRGL